MSEITKPIMLDETGQDIATSLATIATQNRDIYSAATQAAASATAAQGSASNAEDEATAAATSAAAAAQKLDDLETFLGGLDPESAASVAAELGLFEQEVASDYAKKDGYYEQMGVGTADNLAGHGSVNAEYTFRTAGGDSDIGTGAAAIDTVKGNTLVWNQLIQNGNFETVSNWNMHRVSYTVSNNIAEITVDSGQDDGYLLQQVSAIQGHKYCICGSLKAGANKGRLQPSGVFVDVLDGLQYTAGTGNFERLVYITQANSTGNGNIQPRNYDNANPLYARDVICFDLTKMFGSGNEPSTVEEFEARYPLNYYDYNAGTLINNSASGIKTIGFNQWDEQWENGGIDLSTGQEQESTWQTRPANFIPCFPDTDYFFKGPSVVKPVWMYFYDANKVYLPGTYIPINTGNTFHTPANARYMKFKIGYISPDSYKYPAYTPGDICINLSWSGYRNGEYEPYEEHTVYFDTDLGASGSLATIKGRKLNAQGEPTGDSVVVFEDGLKVVCYGTDMGNVLYDEAKGRIATKRIIKVDLGGLTYNHSGEVFYVSGFATTYGVMISRIKCARFEYSVYAYSTSDSPDNTIKIDGNTNLYIHCSSYSTPEAFKTAMNGVYAYCCLVTPETYLLDNPLPSNYVVNDFGTEQRLPADTSSSVMAPILYSVQYAMNATDTIRRLPINYISKDSFENFCASLASAIGPYLNPPATIAVTPTYNDNTQEYDYQVTVTPTENNG